MHTHWNVSPYICEYDKVHTAHYVASAELVQIIYDNHMHNLYSHCARAIYENNTLCYHGNQKFQHIWLPRQPKLHHKMVSPFTTYLLTVSTVHVYVTLKH